MLLPKSLKSIGYNAFGSCDKLIDIKIPDGVTYIGAKAFCDCESLTEITVLSGVFSIMENTFDSCESLKNIDIPNSVTSIGTEAFCFCKELKSIEIPSGMVSVGKHAFKGCESLEAINVDPKNKNYSSENGVFYNFDKIRLYYYPSRVKSDCFSVPESVNSIEDGAFYGCKNLKSLIVSDSVTYILDSRQYVTRTGSNAITAGFFSFYSYRYVCTTANGAI